MSALRIILLALRSPLCRARPPPKPPPPSAGPTPGMEPGAMQPVMDQGHLCPCDLQSARGPLERQQHRVPLGRPGLGRHRLRQALDQVGRHPEQGHRRRRPAAVPLQPRDHDLFRSPGRAAQRHRFTAHAQLGRVRHSGPRALFLRSGSHRLMSVARAISRPSSKPPTTFCSRSG